MGAITIQVEVSVPYVTSLKSDSENCVTLYTWWIKKNEQSTHDVVDIQRPLVENTGTMKLSHCILSPENKFFFLNMY